MASPQILVVEDEGIVARSIQHELEDLGYNVPVIASSGEDAVAKCFWTRPDLVLMDIVLKGEMDGIEAARRIHDQQDVPVVYLTAYEDVKTLERAKATEPFGYLLKPLEEKELHSTIELALQRHRKERKVKEHEEWLATTLRSISDAVIATDAQQRVRFVNPSAGTLTGWLPADAAARDCLEVCALETAGSPAVIAQLIAAALEQDGAVLLPEGCRLRTRDGRTIPVEGSVAPIPDPAGDCAGLVFVLRDVSERLRLEAAHRQGEEHRRQAQKMEAVAQLAAGLGHDFNNLLTVILGHTALVRANLPAADEGREALGWVEAAAQRAAQLVGQLLSFSGQKALLLRPLALNEVIPELLSTLRLKLDPRIAIEFAPGAELWPVQGDRGQFTEVLLNLALNAQDALPEGGRLQLATANVNLDPDAGPLPADGRPGEFVRLTVMDNGPGIAPDIKERIFEPFFSTKEPGKGAGLGLALVYGIVKQHRGWVACSTEAGRGTRFEIFLPRYGQPAAAAPPPAAPAARASGQRTILLADDEPLVRELGRSILQAHGYQVLLAEDGVQAVELYQRERARIDLVILDLTMPRLSGQDAYRQLVTLNPDVAVLFSSGYFAEDLTDQEGGVKGFISKPYRLHELLEVVRAALESAAK